MEPKMKNKLNVEIPGNLEGLGKLLPYKGAFERIRNLSAEDLRTVPVKVRAVMPGTSKLTDSIEKAVERSGLKNGGTISFHHHIRNGDFLLMKVMPILEKMGFRDLVLFPSSLANPHQGVWEYVKKGVVKQIHTSGLRGDLGKFVSRGGMEIPVVVRSHGGRARAIKTGQNRIDVAFIGAPACDREGNINGITGPSACGSLGYAMVDAMYADFVIAVTDNLVDFPLSPVSIPQYQVDTVTLIDKLGNPDKIGSGSTRLSTNPIDHLIAENAARLILNSEYFKEGMSFQAGAGGASLAVAKYLSDHMTEKKITGGFTIGGISSYMVELLKRGIFKRMYDVQSFDKGVVNSFHENSEHVEINADFYANPFNSGAVINNLDVVVLAAYEIDTDFNVNVLVDSHGYAQGASGGHSDTAACAKLTIVVAPTYRARLPMIVERVSTVITPGETVDAFVSERGIAINPANKVLADSLKNSKLPLIDIRDMKKETEKITGKPDPLEFTDKICGLIEYRDGTIIDTIKQIVEK